MYDLDLDPTTDILTITYGRQESATPREDLHSLAEAAAQLGVKPFALLLAGSPWELLGVTA